MKYKQFKISILDTLINNRRINQSGCWEWTGPIQAGEKDGGYGNIYVAGKILKVHRFIWAIENGRPPKKGMCICHHCDNRKCFNPEHLFEGTHQENMADRNRKGRTKGAIGNRNTKAKITEQDIPDIFRLRATGLHPREIGKIYGMSHGQVYKILRREFWGHVNLNPKPSEGIPASGMAFLQEQDQPIKRT